MLARLIDRIRNIWPSECALLKFPHNLSIHSRIRQWIAIMTQKFRAKRVGVLGWFSSTHVGLAEQFIDVFGLAEVKTMRVVGNLNAKKKNVKAPSLSKEIHSAFWQ
jgi:hypothetical protein